MFFPLSVKDIVRDPFDPAARIDREISGRNRRLVIGTTLDDNLQSVSSALVAATGKGKYLRVLNAVTNQLPLPEFTQKLLAEVVANQDQIALDDLNHLQVEIALTQASAIEELKGSAGKYVDRLLVISATQPVSIRSSDQNQTPIPLIDCNVLADQTGLSVISSFAERDILAGGNGCHLDALPAWILFGERSSRVSVTNRILFLVDTEVRAYFLPASDGIDSDLPFIQISTCNGLGRFDSILEANFKHEFLDQIQRLNLQGNDLRLDSDQLQDSETQGKVPKEDLVRTHVVNIVKEITSKLIDELPAATKISEIVVDAAPELLGTFANQFQREWPDSKVYNGFGGSESSLHLPPILAATLGILSIDQLPANIPWLTGARAQKVLGTLTPGSPNNWRQLLRDMADFQPPVMRLRDAV